MGFLRAYYDLSKWALNFYWILGAWMIVNGNAKWFAVIMMFISFLYLISNIAYFFPDKPRGNKDKPWE